MIDRYIPPEARGEVEPIVISESDVDITAARSSGPGGQGVNTTSSKAELRWNLEASDLLDEDQKALVREKLLTRINKDGVLVLHAQKTRSQIKNKKIALERLNELVNAAVEVPKERKATRLPKHKKEKRLTAKKQHSEKKALRKKPTKNDW